MPTVVRAAVRGLVVGVCAMAGAALVFYAALVGPVEVAGQVEGGLTSAVSADLLDQSAEVAVLLFPLVLGAIGAVAARAMRLPPWVPAVPALLALAVVGAVVLPTGSARGTWFDSPPVVVSALVVLLVSYPVCALLAGARRRA